MLQASSSPPRMHKIERESPPIHHPPTLLHPALLAAAQHGGSPDYGHMRAPSGGMNMDNGDRNSDCNSGDISYDGMQPTISFLCNLSVEFFICFVVTKHGNQTSISRLKSHF